MPCGPGMCSKYSPCWWPAEQRRRGAATNLTGAAMTSSVRLRADVAALQALASASRGRFEFEVLPTEARPEALLHLTCSTAGSARYPVQRESRVTIHIALPERYPFQAPVATVRTPIYHPNVFPSGVICLGTRWLAAEGLDLFVQRLLRLVTFDPLLVNTASPANREAAAWYERALRQHPQAFPSDLQATAQAVERVVRACPSCARQLRLQRGRTGSVRCPACGAEFQAQT